MRKAIRVLEETTTFDILRKQTLIAELDIFNVEATYLAQLIQNDIDDRIEKIIQE